MTGSLSSIIHFNGRIFSINRVQPVSVIKKDPKYKLAWQEFWNLMAGSFSYDRVSPFDNMYEPFRGQFS